MTEKFLFRPEKISFYEPPVNLYQHLPLCLSVRLACENEPICSKRWTPREAFIYSRPPPRFSLPFPLSDFLFGGYIFFGGGEAVANLAAALSSGKKAGFSDINGPVGGMVVVLWDMKRHIERRQLL